MAKLNQIIAIEKGIKGQAYAGLTELNKVVQKAELFSGLVKQYQPVDDEGEKLPGERKRVQYTVPDVLRTMERGLSELMAITARKDYTNCIARVDVPHPVAGSGVLLVDVPVSYLLFLEKQLTDMRTFIGNLPVLDEADRWEQDANSGLYQTEPIETHRTKKVQKPIVLYHATEQHPAQTQMVTEDVLAGYWSTTKQSGAIPKTLQRSLHERVDTLLKAVKQAREQANMADEVPVADVGRAVFNYLFDGLV